MSGGRVAARGVAATLAAWALLLVLPRCPSALPAAADGTPPVRAVHAAQADESAGQAREQGDGGEDPSGGAVSDEEQADAAAAQAAAAEREAAGRLGGNRGILPSGIDASSATFVSIARLARADAALDSTLVSFRGEVVGEPVRSSMEGRVWVSMQAEMGDAASIEVLMDAEQTAQIVRYGSYGVQGTSLLVTGIYRVADANQSGALDVVAYEVRLLDPGRVIPERFSYKKLWLGAAFTMIGLILASVNIYRRRRVRA